MPALHTSCATSGLKLPQAEVPLDRKGRSNEFTDLHVHLLETSESCEKDAHEIQVMNGKCRSYFSYRWRGNDGKCMEMTSWAATVAPGWGSRDSAAKAFDRARSVPLHPWSKWDCNVCNGEHTACWPANWRQKANDLGYDDNTMYQIQ